MPFGPPMPYGELETISMPISRNVGTVGQVLVRDAPQDTSTRSWPSFTCCDQPDESASAWMWPPSNAVIPSALPLKGTWTSLTPCCLAICSMVMCSDVPAPGVPYVIVPGLAFAAARSSGKVFHGVSLRTTTPNV